MTKKSGSTAHLDLLFDLIRKELPNLIKDKGKVGTKRGKMRSDLAQSALAELDDKDARPQAIRQVDILGLTDEEIVKMGGLVKRGMTPAQAARGLYLERLFGKWK